MSEWLSQLAGKCIMAVAPSCGGKDEQFEVKIAPLFSKRWDPGLVRTFSTGAAFREEIGKDTPFGRVVKPYVQGGHLVPDVHLPEMLSIFTQSLRGDELVILNGFPRSDSQIDLFNQYFQRPTLAVFLEVSDEECHRRSNKRRRSDDATLAGKLALYRHYKPMMLSKLGSVGVTCVEVDGEGPINCIAKRIIHSIHEWALVQGDQNLVSKVA